MTLFRLVQFELMSEKLKTSSRWVVASGEKVSNLEELPLAGDIDTSHLMMFDNSCLMTMIRGDDIGQ